MATYDKVTYDIPAYQEGNESDFEFEIGTSFPIDLVSDITFQVRFQNGDLLMSKTKSAGELSLTGYVVNIPILSAETLGKNGKYNYEVDFKNLEGKPFATIGGTFIINKQINTL